MSELNERKRLTTDEIIDKQFRRAAYGYEQREVDDFLDLICEEIETLQAEIDELQAKLDVANAQTRKAEAAGGFVPAEVTAPEASFREILEMAQRVKDQTISDAQKKAEEIVAEARTQADAVLGTLEEKRGRLQDVVDQLRDKAGAYRDAVQNLIAEHKAALDMIDLGDDEDA